MFSPMGLTRIAEMQHQERLAQAAEERLAREVLRARRTLHHEVGLRATGRSKPGLLCRLSLAWQRLSLL